jgi:hypothetical protein
MDKFTRSSRLTRIDGPPVTHFEVPTQNRRVGNGEGENETRYCRYRGGVLRFSYANGRGRIIVRIQLSS